MIGHKSDEAILQEPENLHVIRIRMIPQPVREGWLVRELLCVGHQGRGGSVRGRLFTWRDTDSGCSPTGDRIISCATFVPVLTGTLDPVNNHKGWVKRISPKAPAPRAHRYRIFIFYGCIC